MSRPLHSVRRMKAPWFWSALVVVWILDHIPHFERWYPWKPVRGQCRPYERRWIWHHGLWSLAFLVRTRMLGAFNDEMKYRAQRAEEKNRSSAS